MEDPRDRSEERRGHDADLGGSARVASGQDHRVVDEELAQAHALRHDPEQHEMEHHGGDDPEGDAEDALRGEVHVVDELAPVHAGMLQDLRRNVGTQERVGDEDQDDQRQHEADGAPRDLQGRDDQAGAQDDVGRRRIALAKRLLRDHQPEPVEPPPREPQEQRRRDPRRHQHPVVGGDVGPAPRPAPELQPAGRADQGEAGEDEQEEPGQVDAHVDVFDGRPESCRPDVVGGEQDGPPVKGPRQDRAVVPDRERGVVLFLEPGGGVRVIDGRGRCGFPGRVVGIGRHRETRPERGRRPLRGLPGRFSARHRRLRCYIMPASR